MPPSAPCITSTAFIRLALRELYFWHARFLTCMISGMHDCCRVSQYFGHRFVGSLIQPGKYTKDTWRESRTVVLPDLQGLGVGPRMSDAVARLFFQQVPPVCR